MAYKDFGIFHIDLDGAGCTLLYRLLHTTDDPKQWGYINVDNPDVDDAVMQAIINNRIDTHTNIVLADICLSKNMLMRLKNEGYQIQVVDHHKTNYFARDIYPNSIVMASQDGKLQSGTSLLYQYLMGIPDCSRSMDKIVGDMRFLALLVDTIRSYDTYEWKHTDNMEAKRMQILFQLLGIDYWLDVYMARCRECNPLLFDQPSQRFIRARIDSEQAAIDSFTPNDVYDMEIADYKIAFVTGTRGASVSELSYQFLTKYPEYDVFIKLYFTEKGLGVYIGTVRDDLNVGKEFATPLGGGGHPKAAGASLNATFSKEILDDIKDYITEVIEMHE